MAEFPQLRIEVAFSVGASTSTLLHLSDPTRGRLDAGRTLGTGTTSADPVWTDVTPWFVEGQAKLQRGTTRIDSPLVTYEPGTATIPLDNGDRRFDASNLDGPYTVSSGELSGDVVVLNANTGFEAGVTGWSSQGGTFTAATDQVHTGTQAGKITPDGVSANVRIVGDRVNVTAGDVYRASAWVRCAAARTVALNIHWYDSVATFMSASSTTAAVAADTWTFLTADFIAPAGAAQASIIPNLTGTPPAGHVLWADVVELAHLPYRRVTQVTAMRAVRVLATWEGTTYELWRGTVDAWPVEWNGPEHSMATITATDAFKILRGIDRTGVPEVGAGETTGARVNRILDSAGWDVDDRQVATGDSAVQSTTLAGEALAELQQVALTEIGDLYIDGGGRVVFRNRLALLQDARSATPQAVFGDDVGELPYVDVIQSTDDTTFANDIRVTRRAAFEGDTPVEQVAEDGASQALFYRRTYRPPSEPLLTTDAEAGDYARWLLHVSSDPELRFDGLVIEPAQQAADLWPHALGRQIGDRITVRRRPPGGGDPIEHDVFIRGITHEFGGEAWLTTWSLQSADRYGSFLTLDDPLLGRLDTNALAY